MAVVEPKTDNSLEERFQWHEDLDPNHIFDDELAMIKELRANIPQLERESDKFVACFLFARRHKMEEVTALLQRFFSKKEEFQHLFPNQHIPSFKYNPFLKDNMVNGGGSVIHPLHKRDKKGRMLRYFLMGNDKPSGREKDETFVSMMWQTYYQIETEPLNAWRNGIGIVVDLKGAGLQNIDISAKGRELSSALQGTFPFRIRSMLVVNSGWIISVLLTAARVALPKKLLDRIKMMEIPELKEYVPAEYLTPTYGGTGEEYGLEEYLVEISKTEDELFEKGIWKAPPVATDDSAPSTSKDTAEDTTKDTANDA